MAISINPLTFVISIPKADLTLISGTLYELDTEQFRLDLKAWEYSGNGLSGGMTFLKTHLHNTEFTVAGTTYARGIEILAPYSIEFEDGQYSVRLVGSNNNIFDVENGILVQNQVQVIPSNSAGLIVKSIGSGLSPEEQAQLDEIQLRIAELWKLQGLMLTKPMTVTPSSRQVDDIDLAITGDGETTTTVTRQ